MASTGERQPRLRVAGVIVRDEEILLVEHEKDGQRYWLLPGGGVQWGESLEAALIREMHEETGINVEPGPLLLANDSIDPEGNRHLVQLCFLCNAVDMTIGEIQDPRVADARFIPIAKLPTIDLRPAITADLIEAITGDSVAGAYVGNVWVS